jgi:non-ribosomal peptide synthase protein (TIGR01720 family)
MRVDEVLLTALARVVSQWTGRSDVLIDLKGNGREYLLEEVDLSRTVGWFASIAPIRLEVPTTTTDVPVLLDSVKEQLRAIPNRGLFFGVLRYLCGDDELRDSLARIPTPEIAFNYLGRFSNEKGANGSFSSDLFSVGATRSTRSRRLHKLELYGYVLDGRLTVNFEYSTTIHRMETIERLIADFKDALRDLTRFGRQLKERRVTASDFERARLTQRDFGKLMEQLARKDGEDFTRG